MAGIAAVPTQRRGPDEPHPEQLRHAAKLMRRLWDNDPEIAAELVDGLHTMGRVQLGRVIDNLMWTLANQPRAATVAQVQRIRLLWSRKLAKPIDHAAERCFAAMTWEQARRLADKLQAMPDRPGGRTGTNPTRRSQDR